MKLKYGDTIKIGDILADDCTIHRIVYVHYSDNTGFIHDTVTTESGLQWILNRQFFDMFAVTRPEITHEFDVDKDGDVTYADSYSEWHAIYDMMRENEDIAFVNTENPRTREILIKNIKLHLEALEWLDSNYGDRNNGK